MVKREALMRTGSVQQGMEHDAAQIVTENQLDEWVRGHSRAAQGLIVELVW